MFRICIQKRVNIVRIKKWVILITFFIILTLDNKIDYSIFLIAQQEKYCSNTYLNSMILILLAAIKHMATYVMAEETTSTAVAPYSFVKNYPQYINIK